MELLTQWGLGTLFAGIAGLLQLVLLPGLLTQRLLAREHPPRFPLDDMLFIFIASGVLTFQGALLLELASWHTKAAWVALACLQAAVLLLWRGRQPPAIPVETAGQALPLVSLLSLLVFGFCLIQLVVVIAGHLPGVLEGWDAVVSWNRWAQDWLQGNWPYLTWGYPQLVPALWSVLYLWQGSGEIEIFVRLWMALFPLALALVFFAVFIHWRRWSLLVAGAVMTSLLLGPYRSVLDTGYVDVPVTLATLLAGHWVLLARKYPQQAGLWLFYAAFAAAFALLTKQSGVLALALFLFGCASCGVRSRSWRRPLLMLLLLTVPWHVLALLFESSDSVLAYVTGDIYGTETLPQRMQRALTTTLPSVLGIGIHPTRNSIMAMLGIAGLLLALRDRQGRFCTVVGFGYLLVWAAFFSYDGRNLLPGLPFVLLAIAHGFGWMPLAPQWMEESLNTSKWHYGYRLQRALPQLVVVALLLTLLPTNVPRWEQHTNELRKLTGDADFNRRLLAAAGEARALGAVYTTYPSMVAIRELRPYWFNDYGASHMLPRTAAALSSAQPLCDTLATIPQHASIRYLLLHDWIFPAVIGPALADGSLQTLLSGQDLRLMQVQCPRAATKTP